MRTLNTGWRRHTPGACSECGSNDEWTVDGRGNIQCACQACPDCLIIDAYGFHEPGCPTLADDDDDECPERCGAATCLHYALAGAA